MDKAIIIGAGTYGQVYAEYIRDIGKYDIIGYLDDDESKVGKLLNGIRVIGLVGDFEDLKGLGVAAVFVPIGNNVVRTELILKARKFGFETPSFIHPDTNVHSTVKLGQTVYILPGCNIMPHVCISDLVMISIGVNIAHHVVIDKGSFISNGVGIGGSVRISTFTFIGMSACIIDGTSIASKSIIGAGAVVIRNVPNSAVIVGNPGKVLRYMD